MLFTDRNPAVYDNMGTDPGPGSGFSWENGRRQQEGRYNQNNYNNTSKSDHWFPHKNIS